MNKTKQLAERLQHKCKKILFQPGFGRLQGMRSNGITNGLGNITSADWYLEEMGKLLSAKNSLILAHLLKQYADFYEGVDFFLNIRRNQMWFTDNCN